jgi:hypothetical protein
LAGGAPVADNPLESESRGFSTPDPIEVVLAADKPPWRPKVAGYTAFLLSPMAGALVTAASLRRMGNRRKARQVLLYTLLFCFAFLIPFILLIPADAGINKIILIAVEGAGFSVFPSVMRDDFVRWKAANPEKKPRNDWAAAGWGLIGAFIYVAMALLVITISVLIRVFH